VLTKIIRFSSIPLLFQLCSINNKGLIKGVQFMVNKQINYLAIIYFLTKQIVAIR